MGTAVGELNETISHEIPQFETGERVQVGSRVRLSSGQLVRARALVMTSDGWLVSSKDIAADDKTLFAVDEVVESPDEDSREVLDQDSHLTVSEYIKRRALDADGLSAQEKISLMIDDVRRRERKLSRA